MKRQFYITVFKADNVLYPGGKKLPIYCHHVNLGNFGMNSKGEITALPGATIIDAATSPPEAIIVPAGAIAPGTIFPDPHQFLDADFRQVTQIKDMVRLSTFYVSTAEYNSAVVACNPISPGGCPLPQVLTAGGITSSGATIEWTILPGSLGVEYVNNVSPTQPVSDGTFLADGVGFATLTGLAAHTAYVFWIRTVCPGNIKTEWTSLKYDTAS